MATYEVTVTGTNFNVSLTPVEYNVSISQLANAEITAKVTEAQTAASNAATSETNAAASATSAANTYDSFDDRYLGAKASAPAVDNDGDALLVGALYFDTSLNEMRGWTGSAWVSTATTFDSANANITGGTINVTEVTAAQYNSTEALPDIKPSLNLDFANTKALDPRITYTRGSTATYYDGKTFAKAEENLLEYSQEFDNAVWGKANTTVTVNSTTAPDGTTTADTYESLGDASQLSQNATTSAPFVYSVFAKYVDTQYIRLRTSGPNTSTWFDIQNGTIGTNGYSSAAIEDVGNGWYRCSVVEDTTAATNLQLFLHDTNGSLTEVAGSCFLWGAQLEQRSALTDYTATTTQPITNYVPALQTAASGEPRFDHDPITGESKGFLIEEQRTNLVTYSEQFDNAAWTKTRSSITGNIVVAPDGTLTGDKLVEDTTASNTHLLQQTSTITTGSVYSFSLFVKASGRSLIRLSIQGTPFGGVAQAADFNLSSLVTNVSGGGSASIVQVGNGWLRCTLTTISATSTSAANLQVLTGTGTNTFVYTGDGYSGIYLWGAQVEEGSFPTSYIPTVASQVTRSPDAASMTGTNFSSWYRQDEGTVYTKASKDILPPAGTNTSTVYTLSDGGITSNSIFNQRLSGGASNQVAMYVFGSLQTTLQKATNSTGDIAVANAYKEDDFAVSFDGETAITNSTNNVPRNVDQLDIGKRVGSNLYHLNGHIKKLAFWPKRLSNATLQALTEE